MSALSFREQAAIALYAMPANPGEEPASTRDAALFAQKLAEACCARWGHEPDGPTYVFHSPDGVELERIPSAWTCSRCGAKETAK